MNIIIIYADGKTDMDKGEKFISIYDFCETLVDFQTGDSFIHYVREKSQNKRMIFLEMIRNLKVIKYIVAKFDILLSKRNISINKSFILWQLRGMRREQIEKYADTYYKERVKPRIINKVLDRMLEESEIGYKIVIVSASYEPILSRFCTEYGISTLITNNLLYKSNIFTGKLTKADCIGANKVSRLFEIVPDFAEYSSFSYADSKSDIPILDVARQGIIVRRADRIHSTWMDKYGEIVWNMNKSE